MQANTLFNFPQDSVYGQLDSELQNKSLNLVRIKDLLIRIKGLSSCPFSLSDKLLSKFFRSNYQSSSVEAQKIQIIKIWASIKGDYNYGKVLDDIVKCLYVFDPRGRHANLQMFEALVTEGGLNVRSKITTESGEQPSILHRILKGVGYYSRGGI